MPRTPSKASLDPYRKKRDPGRSNEPFAAEPLTSPAPTWSGAFVVHEHHARQRHFDLRLEMAGMLKSFAVPRGPSLDPVERRLAVQTEDHPLAYVEFEGVIPSGNYGAGAMIVWDAGRVRYLTQDAEASLDGGKLDFELSGYKLGGRFALVRTKGASSRAGAQAQWLLLKKKDGFVRAGVDLTALWPRSVLSGMRADELPEKQARMAELERRAAAIGVHGQLDAKGLSPMACAAGSGPLDSDRYLYEMKLDGVRLLADKRGDQVALYYRKGRAATAAFADVARALRAIPAERVLLDGEIIAPSAAGKPDFQRLAQRFQATGPAAIADAIKRIPVSYVAFDILCLNGVDLRPAGVQARKELLFQLVPPRGLVCALDHVRGQGQALFDFCRSHQLEGVVAKRLDSPYRLGPDASSDWIKIKCDREDDFVVIGHTRGKGSRTLGALLLASYDQGELVPRGKVGSGFRDATLTLLQKRLADLGVSQLAVRGQVLETNPERALVRPELVVNVRHQGFTAGGQLRHPVFMGVRADVPARACTAGPAAAAALGEAAAPEASETAAEASETAAEASETAAEASETAAEASETAPEPLPADRAPIRQQRRFTITNRGKVFWPSDGITKGDLCDYYEAVSAQVLPFLRERPVILVRYPDGIEGKSFYQWNAPRGLPSWVRTTRVRWPERQGKEVELFLIDDVETLLYVANLGCIPLHILAARNHQLAQCDFLTIDFDLGQATLADAVQLARALHDVLKALSLRGFPKTSGKTGLHVLVPLGPEVSFETARALAELLGRLLAARHPDVATVERRKEKRGRRVYVDTGQTGPTRAIVAPYSVREVQGARVSTPLSWDEVSVALDPGRFDIFTLPLRVQQVGDLFASFFGERPDIALTVQMLGEMLALGP